VDDACPQPLRAFRLAQRGLELFDAQEAIEQARLIKSAEEIACLRHAMDVCDAAITLRPGMTDNQLWAILHKVNIAHDGEWIESCLL
jgi:Xaa-Pro aminopeptidase